VAKPTGSRIPDYFGQGGRLAMSAAEALVESAYKHDCNDADVLLPGLHEADIAHAIALGEAGVIPKKVLPVLLRGLLELRDIPLREFPIRPALGDVYNSKDALLKERIGDAAGWVHAGRPRREAVNVAFFLAVRARILALFAAHAAMIQRALALAERHVDTLMPDFTYLQHAHPTTFGHYVLTFVYPAFRDLERLRHCYAAFNTSVAGSGSVNGTRLPIDRKRLATLLGFDRVAVHTRDAMWQADLPIELMAALTALLVNLNRLGEELQIWCTVEFDFMEFSDDMARASVIMPQKKNPYGLAYLRGLTGSLVGKLAGVAAVGKTYSGNPDSRVFVYGEVPRALDRTCEGVQLFEATLASLALNTEQLRQGATASFPQATDLADVIMMECELDYRTAHQIVGRVVRLASERGIASVDVDPDLIDEAARTITGEPLALSRGKLATALDPARIVASRRGIGGAAKMRITGMVADCRKKLAAENAWAANARSKVETSDRKRITTATRLANL
jgi:argininosuccinate lyase